MQKPRLRLVFGTTHNVNDNYRKGGSNAYEDNAERHGNCTCVRCRGSRCIVASVSHNCNQFELAWTCCSGRRFSKPTNWRSCGNNGDLVTVVEMKRNLLLLKASLPVQDRSYFSQLPHFFRYPCFPHGLLLRHWSILYTPTHKPISMRPQCDQSENSL